MNRIYGISGRRSVLVADAERFVRNRLSEALREMGLAVYEARRGQEAVDFVSTLSLDALILDAELPDFGGIETIRVIGTFQEVPPYLLIAERLTPELRLAALEGRATSILHKPVDLPVLSEILRSMLARSQ